MIELRFNTFGKIKLLISRLEKVTSNASIHIFPSECRFIYDKICIVTNTLFVFSEKSDILPLDGVIVTLNINHLHNIVKNIPASNSGKLVIDEKTFYFEFDDKKRPKRSKNTKRDILKVKLSKTKIPDTSEMYSIIERNDEFYSSNKLEIDIINLIWTLEKMSGNFDDITLSFKDKYMEIYSENSDFSACSTIEYGSFVLNNKSCYKQINICGNTLLKYMWLLELNSSHAYFSIDDKTLKPYLCSVLNNPDDDMIIVMMN
tara:strand:+ start:944 stop:1723 length:780 start_codon:yes stop_codon:yes gene_type:complete